MAPVDDLVKSLKATVDQLENRVAELEGRLGNKQGSGGVDGMRMILMGPPGAGRPLRYVLWSATLTTTAMHRQRHSGAADKRKVLVLPSRNR